MVKTGASGAGAGPGGTGSGAGARQGRRLDFALLGTRDLILDRFIETELIFLSYVHANDFLCRFCPAPLSTTSATNCRVCATAHTQSVSLDSVNRTGPRSSALARQMAQAVARTPRNVWSKVAF